jgi:hypothetical protein
MNLSRRHEKKNFGIILLKMKELLHLELCITYLHRMRFQSCYAVTSSHINLYERRRPARVTSMTLAIVAFGAYYIEVHWRKASRGEERETKSD